LSAGFVVAGAASPFHDRRRNQGASGFLALIQVRTTAMLSSNVGMISQRALFLPYKGLKKTTGVAAQH
jgi:hypothetical protein